MNKFFVVISSLCYRLMTIEDAIGYVASDELIEVVPKNPVRLRKKINNASQRKRAAVA